jgi:hypothetical protein
VIKVGAATEVEMKEKKARVEDALHATRAAVEEGIVAGGGVALLRARAWIVKLKGDNHDQDAGIKIVCAPSRAPAPDRRQRRRRARGGQQGARRKARATTATTPPPASTATWSKWACWTRPRSPAPRCRTPLPWLRPDADHRLHGGRAAEDKKGRRRPRHGRHGWHGRHGRHGLAKNSHPTSEGILDDLLAGGYIETVGGAVTAGTTSAPAPAAAEPAAIATAPAAASVDVSIESASRYACRTLVTLLGPGADDLTALVEKCKTVEELATRLEKCRDVVQAMAGKRKADEFWAGASARLPKP